MSPVTDGLYRLVEAHVALQCACIATLRPLLRRHARFILGERSSGYSGPNRRSFRSLRLTNNGGSRGQVKLVNLTVNAPFDPVQKQARSYGLAALNSPERLSSRARPVPFAESQEDILPIQLGHEVAGSSAKDEETGPELAVTIKAND